MEVTRGRQTGPYLSKSLFIKGLQCHKSLYLQKYHPELKDEIPASRQAVFKSGHDVGFLAQTLFPGGTIVPYEGLTVDEQLDLTKKEIEEGTETIYEASFRFNDVFVKVDILHKGRSGWEMYEVKGSTSLKDVYFPDASIQYHVLRGAGLPVTKVFLVHINNRYVKNGDIEVQKLFTVNDVTAEVIKSQDSIIEEIERQKDLLKGSMPDINIGPHCNSPYECDFIGHCWQHIPETSVFDIKGSTALPFKLYDQGIIRLEDVPVRVLSAAQKLQVEATLNKQLFLTKESIREFLDSLWYPLCFLDFETFSAPIPIFDGTRPYQQVPFQYSLHCLEYEGGPLQHHEYLAPPRIDPRRELLMKLLSEIPENACVLAYNAGFEAGVLQSLCQWLAEYKDQIETILGNMRDLAVPFRKRAVYHWLFNGSYSLKMVLPALIPDLTYDGMEIHNGDMAMTAYFEMQDLKEHAEAEQLRNALLEYCKLDTFAMVKLCEKLKDYTL